MKLNQAKYAGSERPSVSYKSHYNKIFNKKWYPSCFINNTDYLLYYIKSFNTVLNNKGDIIRKELNEIDENDLKKSDSFVFNSFIKQMMSKTNLKTKSIE